MLYFYLLYWLYISENILIKIKEDYSTQRVERSITTNIEIYLVNFQNKNYSIILHICPNISDLFDYIMDNIC